MFLKISQHSRESTYAGVFFFWWKGACSKGVKEPPEVFCKKSILKNFVKIIGKQLCQSLFFKYVCRLKLSFAKFLRTSFLQNTYGQLLLNFESCYSDPASRRCYPFPRRSRTKISLIGFHKTFLRHHKEMWKWRFKLIFILKVH